MPNRSRSPGQQTRAALMIAVFLAGFSATSLAIGARFPLPHDFLMQNKMDEFRRSANPYNLIFLGPSTTYRHFNAELFDQRLAAAGHLIHSYNMGAPAMHICEGQYLLRRLLAMKSQHIDWVLLDLDLSIDKFGHNPESRRYIAWHDLKATGCDMRTILSSDRHVIEKLKRLYFTVKAAVFRFSNAGVFSKLAGDRIMPPAPSIEERDYLTLARQGFMPLDKESDSSFPKRNRKFLAQTDVFQQNVQQLQDLTLPYKPPPETITNILFREKFLDFLDANAVNTYFYITPSWGQDESYLNFASEKTKRRILALNDIHRYPELYDLDYRFDLHHLNNNGASVLTMMAAEQFSGHLDRSEQ